MKYFNEELFLKNTADTGLVLTDKQKEQLDAYAGMLVKKNEVMNLTAITDPDGIAVKHFADSLTLAPYIREAKAESLADIGTGAGFPGIPLKIAMPELKILLADSLDKRVSFLNEVISALGLEGIKAVHGRAEDLAKNDSYREKFAMVTARAVAPMRVLSEYCLPFVKCGGFFVAMKGSNEEEDYSKAVKILGGKSVREDVLVLRAGEEEMTRRMYCIRKISPTPSGYPRKAGIPSKKPL